jgi:DNA-binding response OmpR family regulator
MPHSKELAHREEDTKAKMVLVVEDDVGIGNFLVQAILQETSHQAMLVTDGFQALKAVASIKPSLFILDYQLPRMNGIELYDQLHAMQGFESIPAIIVSARLPRQEIEKRKVISMSKPLELDDFLNTIDRLLG